MVRVWLVLEIQYLTYNNLDLSPGVEPSRACCVNGIDGTRYQRKRCYGSQVPLFPCLVFIQPG